MNLYKPVTNSVTTMHRLDLRPTVPFEPVVGVQSPAHQMMNRSKVSSPLVSASPAQYSQQQNYLLHQKIDTSALLNEYPEVRLRRPQPQGASFSGENGLTKSSGVEIAFPVSYRSRPSSLSSFCDDNKFVELPDFDPNTDSLSINSRQPNFVQSSRKSFDENDTCERDLLENWLEVEFQKHFKSLNSLILNCSNRDEFTGLEEDGHEILFLKPRSTTDNCSEENGANLTLITGSSQCQVPSMPNVRSSLTNWLILPQSGYEPYSRQTTFIREEQETDVLSNDLESNLKQPLHQTTTSSLLSELSQLYPLSVASRVVQLERLLSQKCLSANHSVLNEVATGHFICLALTEPNDKVKREALLYSYPPAENSQQPMTGSSPFVSRVLRLGGMFITLSEIIECLRKNPNDHSKSSPHESSQDKFGQILQTCHIQVTPDSTVANESTIPTNLPSRTYVFTIIRDKYQGDLSSEDKQQKRLPSVLLLVGVPIDSTGFAEHDCRCLSHLLRATFIGRFGSIQNLFSPFFHSNTQPSTQLFSLKNYLNRTLSIYQTLITPLEKCVEEFSGVCSPLESMITLSSTFFNPLIIASDEWSESALPLRNLPVDDSMNAQTCKLLNYYDSLDWLDESIARFYRKDSMDLEHALSEHFARCLQWCNANDQSTDALQSQALRPPPIESIKSQPNSFIFGAQEDANNNNKNNNNNDRVNHKATNNEFDVLELELSSFVVLGSALFFRGVLVRSNMAYDITNPVYQRLFSNGFLALSKHVSTDLVYFCNMDDLIKKIPNGLPTHKFLLVLGYGHLLHCVMIEVYCFDRLPSTDTNTNFSMRPRGTVVTGANVSKTTLPSSFAFYVFIKESFRFLYTNLNADIDNGGPVDMHYEQQLENIYRLGQQISSESFSAQFNEFLNKKSKKKLSKHEKELGKRLSLVEKANRKKLKDELNKTTGDESSFKRQMSDQGNNQTAKLDNSFRNSINLSEAEARLHPRSLPTTPVKSVIRPASMYSNWSFSSIATGASGLSSSSTTSIGSSSDCKCGSDTATELRSNSNFDTHSFMSSITSRTTNSRSPTLLEQTSDLRHSSVYRFSLQYLPESLVAYLSVEPSLPVQSFYCPIVDGKVWETLTKETITTKLIIIKSVVFEVLKKLLDLRKSIQKLAELSIKRIQQNTDAVTSQNTNNVISSGNTVTLYFDLITGKQLTDIQGNLSSLVVSFEFHLLGQCTLVDSKKSFTKEIGDEFYACFKLNQQNKKLSDKSSFTNSSSQNSRWSFSRLSLKLNSNESKARRQALLSSSSSVGFTLGDRTADYEMNRLECLRGDFEELMHSVRRNRIM